MRNVYKVASEVVTSKRFTPFNNELNMEERKENGDEESLRQLQKEIKRLEGSISDLMFYKGLDDFCRGVLDVRDRQYGGDKDYKAAWSKMLLAANGTTAEELMSADPATLSGGLRPIQRMMAYERMRGINLAQVPVTASRYEAKIDRLLTDFLSRVGKKD